MSVLRPSGLAVAAIRSRPSALAGSFAAFVLTRIVITASVALTVSASARRIARAADCAASVSASEDGAPTGSRAGRPTDAPRIRWRGHWGRTIPT
ncbi:hypothetical protein [Streptomyces sp. NPDC051546]|uniref:hypothetical protein n=1 Tax=Streptomyces sp. NPDC051546 TaxID=3365655 RepID=UPI00379DD203